MNNEDRNDKAGTHKYDDYISWLEGRPNRKTVINVEDITNLKIALGVSHGVLDFLSKV